MCLDVGASGDCQFSVERSTGDVRGESGLGCLAPCGAVLAADVWCRCPYFSPFSIQELVEVLWNAQEPCYKGVGCVLCIHFCHGCHGACAVACASVTFRNRRCARENWLRFPAALHRPCNKKKTIFIRYRSPVSHWFFLASSDN